MSISDKHFSRSKVLEQRDPADLLLPVFNLSWELDHAKDELALALKELDKPSFKFENVAQLGDIGTRAIEVHDLAEKQFAARKAMKATFAVWKAGRGLDWLEKSSSTYQRMVNDAKPEIERVKDLTRLLKNARRRLDNAILRLKKATI